MNEKLRKSGIDIIGDLPWGAHFCQFYRTKEDLTEILVPFFKAGLENNEFCLWITAYPLDAEEAKEALRKAIPDFDIYLKNGQIKIIPYTDWYVKEGIFVSGRVLNGWVEELNQAQESSYKGMRFSWNTSWLKEEEWSNFVNFEKKADSVISNYHMITLCTYSLDAHDLTETIDIVANHQFTLVKKEGKWERIENSGWKNLAKRKMTEEVLPQNGQSSRLKLENMLSPVRKMANLELVDIIDVQAIQSLMEDFYKLAHIPISIIDLKGNVLVGVGWQDICTRFHRVHPETCKHCVESDTKLSLGVFPGEFKLYKCKNNMWDIATPIIVGDQHVGNIFLGHFFFEGEILDYEFFLSQARKYDFDEKEYAAALEKVPRLSKEVVDTSMAFFMKFANMLSQLGYSNIKLAQSLAERDTLVGALRESEKRERARSDELAVLLDAVPAAVWITHDPRALQITGNRLSYEWLRIPEGANAPKLARMEKIPETFKVFKDGVELQLEEMPVQVSAAGKEIHDYEFDIVYPDDTVRHVLGNARSLRDVQGNPTGSISAFIDITERKKAEEALKKEHDNLEKLVEERTEQLEKAYNSLKESEKGLAEAQKMAHIGNWEWNIITEETYWSDELYRIFGRNLEEPYPTYQEILNYVHPSDRDYVNNSVNRAMNGKPYSIDYRILSADGEERIVHMQSEVIFDEKKTPIRLKGIVQDITERKKAEKALINLEIARKREIHHRIKNNLQVISSLLDLQAENFSNKKCIEDSDVLSAFRESQDRIMSIALIHEELHEGGGGNALDFSPYLEKLVENLFQTYRLGNTDINLNMDLEEDLFFDMDIAVPLGIIVNELVSNSLKHAFPDRKKGEIWIKLFKEKKAESSSGNDKKEPVEKGTGYTLIISDNGIGIPYNTDIESSDTLGLQLVNILVDQLDGEIELKRDKGTEFDIRINV
ncbi:PocR ligand-binding domain-containing protein [Methanosarcina sp. UBA411]|jgi:PAS domain S-box-containing protein|uniref:PocR ligand-binding domain-containing protein n=1 Tax=Methanosarcina sp. UBA411 TaxID=1915589 RepID=UPI0025EA9991|nr:PocR ligand-binding domain-containing protein [Methanosarcina sp. UBA411]